MKSMNKGDAQREKPAKSVKHLHGDERDSVVGRTSLCRSATYLKEQVCLLLKLSDPVARHDTGSDPDARSKSPNK
jgi:hypothetical protein